MIASKINKTLFHQNILYILYRFWNCSIIGMHKWTCKNMDGIPPTKEELESGIKGFNSYSKMYCKLCNKTSKLSL